MCTNRTITDIHGHTTTIHDYETYTVLYIDETGCINVADDIYLNYPNDDHIGQDNEEGNGPWLKRIYFDNAEASHREGKNIMVRFLLSCQSFSSSLFCINIIN